MAGSDLTDISGRAVNTLGRAVHLSKHSSSIVHVVLIRTSCLACDLYDLILKSLPKVKYDEAAPRQPDLPARPASGDSIRFVPVRLLTPSPSLGLDRQVLDLQLLTAYVYML